MIMNREEVIGFIDKLIQEKDYTRSTLADELGMSRANISQVFKPVTSRHDGTRMRILAHFGYNVSSAKTFSVERA